MDAIKGKVETNNHTIEIHLFLISNENGFYCSCLDIYKGTHVRRRCNLQLRGVHMMRFLNTIDADVITQVQFK